MSGTPFRAPAALAELPKGAERAIIDKFRQIEAALTGVQVVQRNATAVMNVPAYMAKPGELVLLEGNATGTLVTIPPGSSANVEQTIRIALVGGVLSPGVTIAIIGRKGTIDGAATFVMTQRMLVELTSVGERGWAMTCCGGGGGGEDWAATLVLGNASGGTAVNLTGGSELQMAGAPGALNEVLTSQGPGVSPIWAAVGAGATPAWSATLAVSTLSGANSPSINAGQRLDFAGGGLAGGDVRGAAGLRLEATAGNAILNSAGVTQATGGGNGLSAQAAFAALSAGTSSCIVFPSSEVRLTAGGASQIRMLTNGVERLEIESGGAWQLGGLVGASGNVLTSQGAGTPPLWAAPAAAAVAMTDATVTVAYGAHSATATVVDAAILVGSRVGIFWGTVLDTDVNDPELDAVTFTCAPAAGSMTVRVSSDKAPVGGPYKIRYLIG